MKRYSVRKMGTRAGQPHYGCECIACPGSYGRDRVLAVAHLSREAAVELWQQHAANGHA